MSVRAMDGTCLATLVRMAIPVCRATVAIDSVSRGRGRPPDYPEWTIAVLVVTAVLKRRKSKSAQYRYLFERRRALMELLGMKAFPSRSTYFERYRAAHVFLGDAIRTQGRRALREGVSNCEIVAVDQSKLRALGPDWTQKERRQGVVPWRGIDQDSEWGYSPYHKWIQGYSYEVLVTATKGFPVLPLAASVETANVREARTFGAKINAIPPESRYVIADAGYDCDEFGDRIEYDEHWDLTGCRFVCGSQRRCDYSKPPRAHLSTRRREMRKRRAHRLEFYDSREGKRVLARRKVTVEPFNEWFKSLFETSQRVWHRGLANNRTQILAALFSYQLLLRYNHRRRRFNGKVRWILDRL